MIDFKLQQFIGPLDLLLNLIGEEKLDVSEVSLSAVTEQYLGYLDQMEEKEPNEMADFLLVATRLLLLKSRKLLPQFAPEEVEGPSLEDQLRLYKAFVEASKKLNKRWLSGLKSVFRIEPPRRPTEFIPPKNFEMETMRQSFVKLLERIKPLPPLPQTHIDKAISIREKIEHIRTLLKNAEKVSFSDLLNDSKNRTEVIASFLALLELVKDESVVLKQGGSFKEIMVSRVT